MLTPSQMITSLRYYLDEPTEGYWKDVELIDRLSDSSKRVTRVISGQDPTFFMATTNISFVADTSLYDLPRNARLGSRWDHAIKKDSAGTVQDFVFDMRLRDRVIGDQLQVGNSSVLFSIAYQGSQMRVSPTPSAALTSAIELVYIPVFSDIQQGTVLAATSTTLTLPSSPTVARVGSPSIFDDDNGMEIIIVSGTGVGQKREITDYTGGSTLQCTVAAWDTTPDTSSTYAIISPVPDDFHDVVVLDAALAAGAKSTRRRLDSIGQVYQDRQSEMINWVDERQTFRQEVVIPDFSAGVF